MTLCFKPFFPGCPYPASLSTGPTLEVKLLLELQIQPTWVCLPVAFPVHAGVPCRKQIPLCSCSSHLPVRLLTGISGVVKSAFLLESGKDHALRSRIAGSADLTPGPLAKPQVQGVVLERSRGKRIGERRKGTSGVDACGSSLWRQGKQAERHHSVPLAGDGGGGTSSR